MLAYFFIVALGEDGRNQKCELHQRPLHGDSCVLFMDGTMREDGQGLADVFFPGPFDGC